jgi:uncharacterized sulfatase
MRWLVVCVCTVVGNVAWSAERPNILWLTAEDHGPHLGCYGDAYAKTPNLDALAARSVRFARCWSNAPVCAPARTTLISGMYPTSTGSEHMRSLVRPAAGTQAYPQLLRTAGYYCTNNTKTDYNLDFANNIWDDTTKTAHYKNRRPGQPFFAIFNHTQSHESQLRTKYTLSHDPAGVRLPAYHPDTPDVRRDWARYYDMVSTVDGLVGKALQELADTGLADDTIVFYYADHGSGMPRGKRTPFNSGLHVPLLVHFPPKWAHLAPADYAPGVVSNQLVSFVDFAPTLLSLVGADIPAYLQGVPFLGRKATTRQYLHGFRGRMDERIDSVRSVTDGRYVYVRNYLSYVPHGQHVAYQMQTKTTQVWKGLFDAGKLTPAQATFWQPRAAEELFDLTTDPDEVTNLADQPAHAATLERLRQEQRAQAVRLRDVGLLPEAEMWRRAGTVAPYDWARQPNAYPVERVLAAAELASTRKPEATPSLRALLNDTDSGVRYWAVFGLLMRGPDAVTPHVAALTRRLSDESPAVRVAAAYALALVPAERAGALKTLIELANPVQHGPFVAVQALNAIDTLGKDAESILPDLVKLPTSDPKATSRNNGDYINRLVSKLTKHD